MQIMTYPGTVEKENGQWVIRCGFEEQNLIIPIDMDIPESDEDALPYLAELMVKIELRRRKNEEMFRRMMEV